MQKHVSTDIGKEGPMLQPLLGQSSPSLLKLKPWIRTWSVVAAETWKKVNSELSSWCRVTGTNTLADYKSNSFSDQQQKLSCRKKTIKKQKQLYLTSTDPRVMRCVSTCLPGLQTQAVRRPTMPFVEFILHWLLNKPANEAAGCRYHTVLPLWLQFTSPWD